MTMNKTSLLIGSFCLLVLFIGCDSEKKVEHPQTAHPSTVVTGKIEPASPPVVEQEKGDAPAALSEGQPATATKPEEEQAETEAAVDAPKPIPPEGAIQAAPDGPSPSPMATPAPVSASAPGAPMAAAQAPLVESEPVTAAPAPASMQPPSSAPVSRPDEPPVSPQPPSPAATVTESDSHTPPLDVEAAEADSREESAYIDDKPLLPGYDPTGKVDPFRPLFSSEPESPAADDRAAERRERRTPVTPLEMVDLSQLTLVGVVRAADSASALVEEINGKGYIVKEGTFIGVNSGKVIQILQDKIIVEEEIENAIGDISLQKRELKLQKPLGE